MADMVRIQHGEIQPSPGDDLPLVDRRALDSFWREKGWTEADQPAEPTVPTVAPLQATTTDAAVAPTEAPAPEAAAPEAAATADAPTTASTKTRRT